MKIIPGFDGRIVLYPSYRNLRDYFSWRQVDCHINNLYNTTFWALVQKGNLSNDGAHKRLMKTFSKEKNEILYSQFNINYNFLPDIYKKGTTILRNNFNFDVISETIKTAKGKKDKKKNKIEINEEEKLNNDLINLAIEENNKKKEIENEAENIKMKQELENGLDNKDEKLKNPIYQFSFSDNFSEIYKTFKAKNIEVTNEDIIKDDFWTRNNFVFKKSEENIE
jgi:tRNA(His) guanylyltransferase